jgi:hypothetical protein
MKRSLWSIWVAAAFVIALPAQAALLNFFANLNGLNENPGNTSPGTGTVSLQLNTVTDVLMGNIVFSGLTANTTAAHIHCCLPTPFAPGNVGVATLLPAFPSFPLGVTNGTDPFTLDLNLASSYNPAFITAQGGSLVTAEANFIAALESGRTYLNIHTTAFPGGEIRGFVVPEPMTVSLIMAGFAAAALASRRRRRN